MEIRFTCTGYDMGAVAITGGSRKADVFVICE